jgi:biopolymer transport protein ExbD
MASVHSSTRAEPNLVPILDMVFQLITFFMLVFNLKAQETDVNLKLPVIGSAEPVDTSGMGELLILNVSDNGKLIVQGSEEKEIERYITNAAQGLARRANIDPKSGQELPATVVIRADRSTSFHLLNRVIAACQQSGYRKFNFMVFNLESEPASGGKT